MNGGEKKGRILENEVEREFFNAQRISPKNEEENEETVVGGPSKDICPRKTCGSS